MRFIPKEPRSLPAFGWCYSHPAYPPAHCTWCNAPVALAADIRTGNGALFCPECDTAPRSGGLRVVDLDKETPSE